MSEPLEISLPESFITRLGTLLPDLPPMHPGNFRDSTPDDAIGITAYPLDEGLAPRLSNGQVLTGVQLRIRAVNQTRVTRAAHSIWETLEVLPSVIPGTVVVWRFSATPVLWDSRGRAERFDTYHVRSDILGQRG